MSVERAPLAPGYTVSRLLKGGWQLAGGHGPVDGLRALDDMQRFVDAGVTSFDCADIYVGVEELIGRFLRRLRERDGRAAAERVQVHTKFVPDRAGLRALDAQAVERGVDRSLRRLGVERLDLVQLHWWDYAVPGWVEAGLALAELRRRGKLRHVGVTNFDTARLRQLLDAGVPVISSQVQYSVVDRRPEAGLVALCRERGVSLLCYGALLGGFVAERWLGAADPGLDLENRSLLKYKLIVEEFGGWAAFQRLLQALAAVGHRHGTTPAAVALRHLLDRDGVAGVIVGARHAGHLEATLAALRLRLDDADRAQIDAARHGAPGPAGEVSGLERQPEGRHAAIMKYDLNAEQEAAGR